MNKQSGFTLIELVIVIVVLGILAVAAVPNYINIVSEARQAATDGVAGNLGSGSATNFAIRSGFPAKGVAVATCADVGATLSGGTPTGYGLSGAIPACVVTRTATGETANFTGHVIP